MKTAILADTEYDLTSRKAEESGVYLLHFSPVTAVYLGLSCAMLQYIDMQK